MLFQVLPHGIRKRLKIKRNRIPCNLEIDLKVVVDGAIAETCDFFPGDRD